MKTNLLNYNLNGLTDHFAQMGEKPFRAKQVMRWIHQSGAQTFDEMTDLAKALRAKHPRSRARHAVHFIASGLRFGMHILLNRATRL